MRIEFVVRSDDGEALRATRSALAIFLRDVGAPEAEVFAAEIVIGELLANAYRYTADDVRVTFDLDSCGASLAVSDRGAGPRLPATLPDPQSETGRGHYIVQSLAEAIEATQRDGWTEIRADLRVHRSELKSA